MAHILVVCTANICRSPVAEALLRERLHRAGLRKWTVSSGGTWAVGPYRAAEASVALMAECGLDISSHRAKPVQRSCVDSADLVLCLSASHVDELRHDYSDCESKVHLLAEMSGEDGDVQDPYSGSVDDYRFMIREVSRLLDTGIRRIIQLGQEFGRF
ncbi:MAG: low molecular weight phosphotyrosine protein phosphatase [Xanthomonadales bacterium]|nr:low molecular weight phosphotyrosine protein phosphatase [Xanthomonadales bacterium]